MLSFLYVYSDHSILECYNLFSGVELSMRSFFVIISVIKIGDTLSYGFPQAVWGDVLIIQMIIRFMIYLQGEHVEK